MNWATDKEWPLMLVMTSFCAVILVVALFIGIVLKQCYKKQPGGGTNFGHA